MQAAAGRRAAPVSVVAVKGVARMLRVPSAYTDSMLRPAAASRPCARPVLQLARAWLICTQVRMSLFLLACCLDCLQRGLAMQACQLHLLLACQRLRSSSRVQELTVTESKEVMVTATVVRLVVASADSMVPLMHTPVAASKLSTHVAFPAAPSPVLPGLMWLHLCDP